MCSFGCFLFVAVVCFVVCLVAYVAGVAGSVVVVGCCVAAEVVCLETALARTRLAGI